MGRNAHVFPKLALVRILDLRGFGPMSGACRKGGGGGNGVKGKKRQTLWKSYLLSWRTKDAKFECLNIRGRMDFVNSFISYRGRSGVLISRQRAGQDDSVP